MEKMTWKNFKDKTTTERTAMLYVSFCKALREYCDNMGIMDSKAGAPGILHSAIYNTVAQMHDVTPADVRVIARLQCQIPQLVMRLWQYSSKNGYIRETEMLSEMSLAQVVAHLKQNSR